MKKVICIILGIMMLVCCTAGPAEGADGPEGTVFLRIRESRTAQVYEAPGSGQTCDALENGRFCGLIEETEKDGDAWFYVFYMSSGNQGAIGCISAEEAETVTRQELGALMDEPATAEEILGLIGALDGYLQTAADAAAAAPPEVTEPQESAEEPTETGRIADFLRKAIAALRQVLQEKILPGLRAAAEKGKEKLGEIKGALEAAAKKAENLLGEAGETLEKLGKAAAERTRELISSAGNAMSRIREEAEEGTNKLLNKIREKAGEALNAIDRALGKGAGAAIDAVSTVMEKAEEVIASDKYKLTKIGAGLLSNEFREGGFRNGIDWVKRTAELIRQYQDIAK